MSSLWKGVIGFGLVSIPVRLDAAILARYLCASCAVSTSPRYDLGAGATRATTRCLTRRSRKATRSPPTTMW